VLIGYKLEVFKGSDSSFPSIVQKVTQIGVAMSRGEIVRSVKRLEDREERAAAYWAESRGTLEKMACLIHGSRGFLRIPTFEARTYARCSSCELRGNCNGPLGKIYSEESEFSSGL
jgi:hypothetical protein